MSELNKLKITQLPYMIKDLDGNYIGQISMSVNYNLTNVSFVMNFQTENKVLENKELIKQAYVDMQNSLKDEMTNYGWGFLFEESLTEEQVV